MSWRDLMQAKPRPTSDSPDLRNTSTKSTKPCGQVPERPDASNFVDIVDEHREPECSDLPAMDPAEMVEPSNARLAFDLNSNLPDQKGAVAILFPSGQKIRFQSPMWGELEAEVLDDRGAVVWCWHPIQHCECCIPREWILGLVDEL